MNLCKVVIILSVSLFLQANCENLVCQKSELKLEIKSFRLNSSMNLEQSAIIFISEAKDLNSLQTNSILTNEYPKKLKFLIYCHGATINDIKNILMVNYLRDDVAHIGQFEYFLVNTKNGIKLLTFEWFTRTACNHPQLIDVNTLHQSTNEWENQLQVDERFQNLHQCTIFAVNEANRVFTHEPYIVKRSKIGSFSGLMDILSDRMNFGYLNEAQRTYLTNVAVYVLRQTEKFKMDDFKDFQISRTFYETKYGFMISEPEKYSIYEKLLMPFDFTTWIFLLVIFLSAFGFIFVINQAPRWIQHIIYGKNVRTPAFNILGTFFGIGQVKLPVQAVPRFVLMLVIFFCLIFRTCYQSKMFEFMTTVMNKPQPATIDDLYEMNFKIITLQYYLQLLKDTVDPERRPQIETPDIEDFLQMFFSRFNELQFKTDFEKSAKIKAAFFVDTWYFYMPEYPQNFPSMYLSEILMVEQLGYGIYRNHFLMSAIDEIVMFLVPSGIIQLWSEHIFHYDAIFKDLRVDTDPKVFKFGDLSFGFEIWLASCAIPFGVFLIEMLFAKITKKKNVRKFTKVKNAKVHPEVQIVKAQNSTKSLDVRNAKVDKAKETKPKLQIMQAHNSAKSLKALNAKVVKTEATIHSKSIVKIE